MKRLLISFRLFLTLAVAFTGFNLALLPQAHAEGFYYSASPEGTVGILMPKIGFQITKSSVSAVSRISLQLDGQTVQGQFDPSTMTYTYQPTQPLATGKHQASITVELTGYQPIVQDWSFTISPQAVTEAPKAYSDKQLEMVRAINDYRLLSGLPALQINPNLTMAAKLHADYLQSNNIDVAKVSMHEQKESQPGFIGAKPGERALYAGYYDNIAEDVSYYAGNHIESIDSLFDAPYHRIPFLLPSAKEVGVAMSGPFVVIEFGFHDSPQQQLVVTPSPGEKYVPVTFDGNEDPDPIRMYKDASYPVGYPIVAHISGTEIGEVKLIDATLKDADGKNVELLKNSPQNDNHLIQEVILTPAKPLLPDTSYTAYVKMTSTRDGSTQTFEKAWQFQTEPAATVGKNKLHADSPAYKKLADQKGSLTHVVTFSLNGGSYTLDGVKLNMTREPAVIDGSSYLWVRDLAAALGAQVEWNDAQKAAIYTKGGRTISFFTTRPTYSLDGKETNTDVPAKLVNDNTMIPVRLLSEVLGAKVEYNPDNHSVTLTY
ncbi:stalk domain-containing protein [Paenibacillus filicis]|uniref:Stalk domain-containing protein n=1 Tax=Paenibacillus filicis TaxID=669464 RepID=A0ABU9DPJ0_9BACL